MCPVSLPPASTRRVLSLGSPNPPTCSQAYSSIRFPQCSPSTHSDTEVRLSLSREPWTVFPLSHRQSLCFLRQPPKPRIFSSRVPHWAPFILCVQHSGLPLESSSTHGVPLSLARAWHTCDPTATCLASLLTSRSRLKCPFPGRPFHAPPAPLRHTCCTCNMGFLKVSVPC